MCDAARMSPPGRFRAQALDGLDVDVAGELVDLGCAARREPHQFDEVAAVFRVRLERQPAHTGIVGRQPEDVPEVSVRPAPLRGPEQVRGLCDPAGDEPAGSRGQDAEQAFRRLVADDGRLLEDARSGLETPVGRLELPLARGHFAEVGVLVGAPSADALLAASLRKVRFAGASVPTSVSLSSPRMKASTRLNAMSSWICCGGLFMK